MHLFAERGIGENCIEDEQCKTANKNSVCNSTTKKCDCEQGHIWNFNTCLPGKFFRPLIFSLMYNCIIFVGK